MIVDVNLLNLQALRCFAYYNASTIALSEEYGFHCNIEEYEDNLEKALKYLFLAEHCSENLTNSIFCQIQEYIDDVLHNSLYSLKINEDCSEVGGGGSVATLCTLTITDNITSCTGGLTINILQ